MKRLLITGTGPQHKYVANRLASEAGLHAIIVDMGKPQSRTKRVHTAFRRYSVPQLVDRVIRRIAYAFWRDADNRASQVHAVLGADAREFANEDLVHRIKGINTPPGEALIRRLDADQILIFGTTIVGSRILKLSRQPALNMHTGISPFYRGSSCAFWPIHDGRFDMLGATVHECVPQVDGGAIYAVGQARLRGGDPLHGIFARCVEAGTDLYVDVINDFAAFKARAQPQDLSTGNEFRAADRTFGAELQARRRLARGELEAYLDCSKAQNDAHNGIAAH